VIGQQRNDRNDPCKIQPTAIDLASGASITGLLEVLVKKRVLSVPAIHELSTPPCLALGSAWSSPTGSALRRRLPLAYGISPSNLPNRSL
jgi:hypothetical protein